MSGLLRVLILTSLGYLLGKTPVFPREDQLMSCLMLLPVALLVFGLIGSVVLWKKKHEAGATDTAKRPSSCASSAGCWVVLSARRPCSGFGLAVQQQEANTLAIRPVGRYRNATAFQFSIISMPTASALKHHAAEGWSAD